MGHIVEVKQFRIEIHMKLETSWLWIFKDQFWKLVLFGRIASLLFIKKINFWDLVSVVWLM